MRAVDTNVLVRALVRDDPRHTNAADETIAQGAWVSTIVLAETIWVLTSYYRLRKPAIVTAIQMLANHVAISLQDPAAVEEALTNYKTSAKVAFSDCLILAMARRAGHAPLMTFDQDLGRLNGAQLVK